MRKVARFRYLAAGSRLDARLRREAHLALDKRARGHDRPGAVSPSSFPRRREPTLIASYVSPLYCRTFWTFHMRAGQILIRSARVLSAVRRAGSMTPRSLMLSRN